MQSALTGLVALLAVALLLLGSPTSETASAGTNVREKPGYGWPLAPCDQQHAIRAHVGAPRTIFRDRLEDGGLDGPGRVSLHNGVDIVAQAGTAVYPVLSGTVRRISGGLVVTADDGREFRYQHISRVAMPGERVRACRTVLGYVLEGKEHVHFAEVRAGKVINPLSAGHLRPYTDTTRPTVASVKLVRGRRASQRTDVIDQRSAEGAFGRGDVVQLRGVVRLGAEAHDVPALPVRWPLEWAEMPVIPLAPAVLELGLRRPGSGKPMFRMRSNANFSKHIPRSERFWRVYRRGTHQNWPVIGRKWHKGKPGSYQFRFPALDTRKLPNGFYALSITARDVRGNDGSLRIWVRIKN